MILQLHDKNYTFSLFSEKAPYESYKNVGFLSNILIHSPANHVIPQTKFYIWLAFDKISPV